ncbi:MAG: thioredoxin domain-containing protein [Acidobacteria bacterium]|nr:thioredoxin domain-containing protein [Acidobacteriota bacterium]
MSAQHKNTNRLANETSPYLLQHAHNPVDWYPWGPEALRAAQEQDKPILLSIGYSACHWCHVMERESFESEAIAAVMNENFISIKVDREERPDLDSIYMNFVQMTTGSGGWPMTVFLTPDQTPFFGGTYFPPHDQYGRPGFKRLLASIAHLYRARRSDLEKDREKISRSLQEAAQLNLKEAEPAPSLLDEAYRGLLQQFDSRHGGFGGAPKFPSSMALAFLLRYYRRRHSDAALDMVNVSLTEMARGGIFDQLGGGFHRYSVDERWLVPHFEKMLYDNALLSRLYLEAFQVTGNRFYRQVVEETLAYAQREMLDPAGGFYSSQDADSEGKEGKFFVWTPDEVSAALGREDAKLFGEYFDVTASGNFEGRNILHHRIDLEAYSRTTGMTVEELLAFFARARRTLLEEREKRVKPGRDDKILAAWNGMMLTAFAEAAFVFGDRNLLETALRNARFLVSQFFVNGRLLRSWKQGEAKLNGYLEDYAQVIEGLIATYQASGDVEWMERAQQLMELQLQKFWDASAGDFYFTSSDHEPLLVRQKEYFDNATPSGNSVSCLNLLRLSMLAGEKRYRQIAEQMLRRMSAALADHPSAFGYWLQALDFFFGPVQEIAVVGVPGPPRERLMRPLRERFLPNKALAVAAAVDAPLAAKIPLLAGKTAADGRPTAYVCRDYACLRPATSPEELEKQLE